MNIKKIANTVLLFTINRLIEILAIGILIIGLLLLIALIYYSPTDPNFIFPQNTEIQNLLGFQGSYVSDLFLQSIGIMSYLISLTIIFTGINIFKSKDLFLIIENIFFAIMYSAFGSLFFSFFYQNSYSLFINGNGGFVGNYLDQTFLSDLIKLKVNVSYYFLIIITLGLFLISINFNLKKFWNFLKKFINLFSKNNKKPYIDKSEIIKHIDVQNPRRVLRAIEVMESSGRSLKAWQDEFVPKKRSFNWNMVALDWPREVLYSRIDERVDRMIQEGLEHEVRELRKDDAHKLDDTIGYQEWLPFFSGDRSKSEVIRLIKRNSRRYAKRQLTWFRNQTGCQWVTPEASSQWLSKVLEKHKMGPNE